MRLQVAGQHRATVTHAVQIPPSVTAITWLNQDTPVTTWFMAEVPHMFQTGAWLLGALFLAAGAGLYHWYHRHMTKVAHDIDAANPTKPQTPAAAND